MNLLWSFDLKQMIRYSSELPQKSAPNLQSESNDSQIRSEVLIWIKWFANPLWISDLNQVISETAPKFQKIRKPALNLRYKSNDLRYARSVLWSPSLNQMNPDLIKKICNRLSILKIRSESNDTR